MAEAIPDAEFVLFESSGHYAPAEEAEDISLRLSALGERAYVIGEIERKADEGGAVIVVSHDRDRINAIAHRSLIGLVK